MLNNNGGAHSQLDTSQADGAEVVGGVSTLDQFSGVYPGAVDTRLSVLAGDQESFVVMHRDIDGGIKTSACASTVAGRQLVEELIGQGVDQKDIAVYETSKIEFKVSFRPVVQLFEA